MCYQGEKIPKLRLVCSSNTSNSSVIIIIRAHKNPTKNARILPSNHHDRGPSRCLG